MEIVTRKEAAFRAGVAPETVSDWMRRGLLKPVKSGWHLFFAAADVDAIMQARARKIITKQFPTQYARMRQRERQRRCMAALRARRRAEQLSRKEAA